jgi:hypothetical protein
LDQAYWHNIFYLYRKHTAAGRILDQAYREYGFYRNHNSRIYFSSYSNRYSSSRYKNRYFKYIASRFRNNYLPGYPNRYSSSGNQNRRPRDIALGKFRK